MKRGNCNGNDDFHISIPRGVLRVVYKYGRRSGNRNLFHSYHPICTSIFYRLQVLLVNCSASLKMRSFLTASNFLFFLVSAAPLGTTSNELAQRGNHGYSDQVPFSFPLSNGFPNIKVPSPALTAIEQQAHGTLPNTPLPSSLAVSRSLH